jgi:ABC-2 type transport system permease protein
MGIELPATADQGRVFRNLRLMLFRNGLRVALANGRARLFGTLMTCVVVSVFTYGVGLYLFDQLAKNSIPFKGAIVEALFDLLFFTLGSMLVFSTGIILYASLFTSPEARFLLCSPARADHIFATKFQGAIAFSSWGFVVLGIPIFLAFGSVSGVPWYFYALLPAYLLGYVLLPGSVSAALCLLLVRYMPKNRKQFFLFLGLAIVAVIVYWCYHLVVESKRAFATNGRELHDLIGQFDLFRSSLAPSHWMTRGVMAAARGDWVSSLVTLAQVWSNGLLLFVLATWLSKRVYRSAYDRLAGGGRGRKIYRTSWLDRVMEGLVFFLEPRTRVLVVKDFRTFRRDPTQWALLLIFGLLMLLGASNFRQYYAADLAVMDKYAISLMNLSGTAILLCAGLSRFIFPLISLEGKKFWILGLTPISRDQLLWGKFVFATVGSLLISESLILTSDLLLGLPIEGVLLHAVVLVVLSCGLSAMNVGLGAYMPTFRETDPSKIVLGFGGTVNMVAGLAFLVSIIGLMAVPFHASQLAKGASNGMINPWAFAGMPVGVIVGALAVMIPLRVGARSLRRIEF